MHFEVFLDFGNGRESCTSMNSVTVAEKINQVKSDPVPANVARTITFASNQVLEQLARVTKEIAITAVRLVAQAADAGRHGGDISRLLANVSDAINSAPPPVITAPGDPIKNPFDGTDVTDILDEIDQNNNDTQNAINEQGEKIKTLGELTAQYSTLQNAFSDSVEVQRVANEAFRAQVVVSNDAMRDAVLTVEAAYGDLVYAMSQLRRKVEERENSGGGLSSATMGLLITGCVLGTLAAIASIVPLVAKYGPGLMNKANGGLRRSNDEMATDDEDEEDSGEEDDEESAGEESGEDPEPYQELQSPPQPTPQQANTAAQAIMLARES